MIPIEIVYLGELRCRAVHGPSGQALTTDAPRDNMGRGESFSPTDLVAAALGTCIMTIMGIAARKHQIDLSGAKVIVHKAMVSAPARRIGKLAVHVRVPAQVSDEHRVALENAAKACPVHRSLHPDVEAPITFEWGSEG